MGSGLPATRTVRTKPRRCLTLHPVGFTLPRASQPARCALTAPFHPYSSQPYDGGSMPLLTSARGAVYFLWHCPYRQAANRPATVGVTHHRSSVVPGLSSPCRNRERPSTHLATNKYTRFQAQEQSAPPVVPVAISDLQFSIGNCGFVIFCHPRAQAGIQFFLGGMETRRSRVAMKD